MIGNKVFFNQKVDVKVICTWNVCAFNDIPGPGKYGFSCSGITIALVFYCDAKYSDTIWSSSNVCCYLFLGVVVKKERGFLDHETLKSAVPQENELILHYDTNLGKLMLI